MVIQLLTTLNVTAGVINLSSSDRSVKARLGGHVGLKSDDGCDVVLSTHFVKFNYAVKIAVVGDTESFLSIGFCRNDKFFNSCGPVQHRIFGVVV